MLIKPYPCCRHIQPAVKRIGILRDENLAPEQVEGIDVATYRIAAEHAGTGWDDFASAQLSFPYLLGLALKFRGIKFEHFEAAVRRDPEFTAIARKISISAPPEIDRLYPQLRPARVSVTSTRGTFTRQADEALGSRIVPLDDAGCAQSSWASSLRSSARMRPRRWRIGCGASRTPATLPAD